MCATCYFGLDLSLSFYFSIDLILITTLCCPHPSLLRLPSSLVPTETTETEIIENINHRLEKLRPRKEIRVIMFDPKIMFDPVIVLGLEPDILFFILLLTCP